MNNLIDHVLWSYMNVGAVICIHRNPVQPCIAFNVFIYTRLCPSRDSGVSIFTFNYPHGAYVVAKPRVISIITITSASFLLCQYRRHNPGRHLCVSTSTFFFIPYGMPQLNVVRSRSPVSQECIANCGVPCGVSTGRPPGSRPFYHLVTVISITFRRFFFRLPLEG